MNIEIGSYEAKTKLPELLRGVQQGNRYSQKFFHGLIEQAGLAPPCSSSRAPPVLPQCGRIGGIPGGIGHWPQCPDMD